MISSALSSAAAKYKSGKDAKFAETLSEEDEKEFKCGEEGLSISATSFMAGGRQSAFPGGPFSAVTPSMCPQDILAQIQNVEETYHQPEYRFDEFGFKIEVEDGPEDCSSKILSVPMVEDPQHRLKWIAHLEFTHNQVVEDLTWNKIEPLLPRSDKLKSMVRTGVPNSLRPFIWPRLCGATLKKRQATFSYNEILKLANTDKLLASKHIEKDLLRTMPHNACFMGMQSTGIPRLRRILRAIGYLYPEIGYCQGMGVIVCSLLLVMEEEPAFWMMVCIIEDLVPASYYSNSLIGVQADQLVLQQLTASFLPEIESVLQRHDIELALISLHWFLTAFASVVHMKILVRIWDVFFYEGSICLFQLALGLLKIRERDLRDCNNSAQLFNILSDLPSSVEDADYWLDVAFKVAPALTDAILATHRKKHLAYLMAEQGVLVNPESESNLPKQKVQRRKLKRSQSVISHLFHTATSGTALDDLKLKNVRQTELLVDLKNAILKVARHFLSGDAGDSGSLSSGTDRSSKVSKSVPRRRSSSNSASSRHGSSSQAPKVNLQADYSIESHARDHEQFIAVHQSHRKRARALLDFERHDDDELGFRKNDVIVIISQKDEHCWIGELNGLRGWFPAKFVEVLDERSKNYCALGDDAVCAAITDLVRGTFCPCLKAVFEHGIKKTPIAGGPTHPWLFIEEVAKKEVQRDFDSVYSRLVLCRTFKLDQDGKVLTPEELLYKAVQAINVSHDAKHAQMDVKFRSLICMGLNEQVLHLWFELLCSSNEIVRKWFHRWSYIRSPCWVQIKCELRLLAQFAFSLSPNWELGTASEIQKPLKEGVRDMLVKHHLFSWDL